MDTNVKKHFKSEKRRIRTQNNFDDTAPLFIPVHDEEGDSKNNDIVTYIYQPPQSFLMAYFGVKAQPKIVQQTKSSIFNKNIGTKNSTKSLHLNQNQDKQGDQQQSQSSSNDFSEKTNNLNQNNMLCHQQQISLDFFDYLHLFNDALFNVWNEDRDPTHFYFQGINSECDLELLNLHTRKRKVLGLFLILNLLNFFNLLFPEPLKEPKDNNTDKTDLNESFWDGREWLLKCLVNLVCECLIFAFTFYVCFCSQIGSLCQDNVKLTLILCISLQYIVASLFSVYPNLFVFQFIVNASVMFILIVKEVITNKKLLWLLLANTFAVNYVAMQGLKYQRIQAQIPVNEDVQPSLLDDTIRYDEYARAHIIGMIGVVLQVVQIQCLNRNLIRMLVSKIAGMQQTVNSKDTYHASMIHELRNPLNAVLGSIGLLRYSKSLSREDQETLNIASVSGEILITLINNALDGAKLQAGKLELDFHMGDVVEILAKAVSLFSWKARDKKVNMVLKISKTMPHQIQIDEARLTQVLVNLIGNAVKFTPSQGQVKVRAQFLPNEHFRNDIASVQFKKNFQQQVSKKNASLKSLRYLHNKKAGQENEQGLDAQNEYEDKFFYNKEFTTDLQIADEHLSSSPLENNKQILEGTGGAVDSVEFNLNQVKSSHGLKINRSASNKTLGSNVNNNSLLSSSYSSVYNLQPNELALGSTNDLDSLPQTLAEREEIIVKNSFIEWEGGESHRMQTVPAPILSKNLEKANTNNADVVNPILNSFTSAAQKSPYFRKFMNQKKNSTSDSGNSSIARVSQEEDKDDDDDDELEEEEKVLLPETRPHHHNYQRKISKSKFFKESPFNNNNKNQLSNIGGTGYMGGNATSSNEAESSKVGNNSRGNFSFKQENSNQLQHDDSLLSSNNYTNLQKLQPTRQRSSNLYKFSDLIPLKKVKKLVSGTFMIEVIDTGIGISQDAMQRLFKPYSQADKSIQTKYGGTGLGLWISQKLVSLMNGRISVASELNKGTVFIIEIPVQAEVLESSSSDEVNLLVGSDKGSISTNQMPLQTSKTLEDPSYSSQLRLNLQNNQQFVQGNNDFQPQRIQVLLYQQDEFMKNLLKKYLQKHNIQFTVASSFKEFLKIFKVNQFRACFIDIDINVKEEDLEKLLVFNNRLRDQEPPFKCRIYCFYSRDIDKKHLEKNHIYCVKKPIQSYQLSKYLKKLKSQELQDNQQQYDAVVNRVNDSINPLNLVIQHKPQADSPNSLLGLSSSTNHNLGSFKTDSQTDVYAKKKTDGKIHNLLETGLQSQSHGLEDDPIFVLPCKNKAIERIRKREGQLSKRSSKTSSERFQENLQNSINSSTKRLADMARSQNSPGTASPLQSAQQDLRKASYQSEHEGSNNSNKGSLKSEGSGVQSEQKRKVASVRHSSLSLNKRDHIMNNSKDYYSFRNMNQMNASNPNIAVSDSERYDSEELKSLRNRETPQFNFSQNTNSVLTNSVELVPLTPSHLKNPVLSSQHSSKNNATQKHPKRIPSRFSQKSLHTLVHQKLQQVLTCPQILIADDNALNTQVLHRMLEMLPVMEQARILTASNGQEAVDLFMKNQNIVLVLIDCEMPIMDGYEASTLIRQIESSREGKPTRIVGVSGNSGEQFQRRCIAAGMNDTLAKPFSMDQIKIEVEGVLKEITQIV